MVVLVILLSVFTVTWGLLAIAQHPRQIRTAGCIAFAALFIFTGISHFGLADGMVQMLPAWVPGRYPIIYITGIMEIVLGLGFLWPSVRRLPFADASFDAVIFAHVLEHMAEPVETLREMVRVLKPGAPLISSVTRRGLGQLLLSLRWHNRGYAAGQLDAGLQAAGLEAVKSFDYGTGWSRWMCIAAIGVKPK